MVKFVNFGCWNKTDNKPGLKDVFNEIKKEENIDFFIVNGDNYYQKKNKNKNKDKDKKKGSVNGEKTIHKNELIDGFNLLSEVITNYHQELYLLMGNHDLEMINSECETTRLEKFYVDMYNINKKFEQFHFPNDLVMFKEIDDNIIIMIDTNIYTELGKDKECYKIINADYNDGYDFIKQQKIKITEQLGDKKYKNIIVCGHHPLFGIKNQKMKENKLKGGIETLHKEIYELFLDVIKEHSENVIYLCADVHNYQKGKVTITKEDQDIQVQQYIVGTGGADLDDDYNEKYNNDFNPNNSNSNIDPVCLIETSIDDINLKYEIDQHTSQYGYIVVEIINGFVTIQPRMIQGKQINKCTNIKSRKRGYSLPLRRTYKTKTRSRSKRRSVRKIKSI